MELVFVTNNPNKLNEIQSLVSHDIAIKSLKDINFHDEIDETELTLEGNALLKARHIHSKFGLDCFADDTGLEIEALNGAPGVFSARYAGAECIAEDNINKGISLLISYSLGLALPFILSGYFMSRFLSSKKNFSKYYNRVTKTGGTILLITGILITTNQIQVISYYILTTFPFLTTLG